MASPKGKIPIRSKERILEFLEPDLQRLPVVNPSKKPLSVPETIEEFADTIAGLFRQAEQAFMEIGTLLERAKEILPHGQFIELVTSRLPFQPRAAQKMMAAAKAVRDGIVPAQIAPPSYTVVYEIVSLRPEEREQAMAAGLVRPDVRREEVVAFKRRLRAVAAPERPEKEAIQKELDRLLAERERLDQRISELRTKLEQ